MAPSKDKQLHRSTQTFLQGLHSWYCIKMWRAWTKVDASHHYRIHTSYASYSNVALVLVPSWIVLFSVVSNELQQIYMTMKFQYLPLAQKDMM